MNSMWRLFAVAFLGLLGAHWLHAAPFAYIKHDSGVSVVDLTSRTVIAELPASSGGGIAVNPDANRAYASDRDRISVIDTNAQAIVATVGLPTIGGPIALRPGRGEAYVITDHCSNVPGSACTADLSTFIRVLNTDNNTLGASFGDNATARLAFSPDSVLMFVTRFAPDEVAIMRTDLRDTLVRVPLLPLPLGMAVDPAGRFLYVAEHGNSGDGSTVAVVDIANRTVAGRISVGLGPSELVMDAHGARLYVTNTTGNTVSVVDTASRSVVATLGVGSRPVGIDITPDGDRIVVANSGSGTVSIIDSVSLRTIFDVPVRANPTAIGRFIVGHSAPIFPDTLTGLWWNPAESGWGVHVAHRGSKIFAAWFTYNPTGAPKWYVSSDCVMNSQLPCPTCSGEATCTGNLYETTGPRFFSEPYSPGAVTTNKVGLFQMGFSDRNTGFMSFVVGTAVKTLPLRRQVFRTEGPAPAIDYTDLWWNPAESGWGIGITQQFGTMFLAWFAYDDSGTATWYVASNCVVNASGNGCSGDLYRTTGPADPIHNAFDPSRVRVNAVGSISASFLDANSGVISYTVDGKSGSKAITRQLF